MKRHRVIHNEGYRGIQNEKVQGDPILNNNSLDQPEQVNDTECSIMKGYKVIHNERIQGDHYFWNNVFEPNSCFNIELIGPTLTTEG